MIKAPERRENASTAGRGLEWALDSQRSFSFLLGQAEELAAQPAPARPDPATGGPRLNLYLVACALAQVLADHRHAGFYELPKAGTGPLAKAAAAASSLAREQRRAQDALRGRQLAEAEDELGELAIALGGELLGRAPATDGDSIRATVARISARRYPESLRRTRLRMPLGFQDLDLTLEDAGALAEKYAAEAGSEPSLVVAVRTSGCYLAPVAAAILRSMGREASLQSLRPDVPRFRAEIEGVRRVARAGGSVLVVDDAVWTANALGRAHNALVAEGIPADRVWLAVWRLANQPVYDPATRTRVWSGFAAARKVCLAEGEWEAERRLMPDVVRAALNSPELLERLGAEEAAVLEVEVLPPAGPHLGLVGSPQRRSHVKAVYLVELRSQGRSWRRKLLAKGAGPGFFGYHSLLIGERLAGLVPEVVGLHQGMLFSQWVEGIAVDTGSPPIEGFATYLRARRERLRLTGPAGDPPAGLLTAGERALRVLTRGLGRGAGRLARHRLRPRFGDAIASGGRSVVDGKMGPREWLLDERGEMVKVDFEEHGFDAADLIVEDWIRDAADLAVSFGLDRRQQARLVELAGGGGRAAEERLLAYKLQIASGRLEAAREWLRDLRTAADRADYAGWVVHHETASSDAVNDYLALRLPGPTAEVGTRACAIDLDDTLESEVAGFPAATVARVQALRMLQTEGLLPLLCSGRSAQEVAHRCRQFGLRGGIAEHGAALHDSVGERTISLLEPKELHALDRLRRRLAEVEVFIDPRHRSSIRLFQLDGDGRRGPSASEICAWVGDEELEGIAIREQGHATDLVPARLEGSAAFDLLLDVLGLRQADAPTAGHGTSPPQIEDTAAAFFLDLLGLADRGWRARVRELSPRSLMAALEAR